MGALRVEGRKQGFLGSGRALTVPPSLPQSVQGTGLAFIAFTEAMTHFPASPFWSVMFFLMLINLGLGSMIGTMAGITTPIIDTFKVPKEMFTGNPLLQTTPYERQPGSGPYLRKTGL